MTKKFEKSDQNQELDPYMLAAEIKGLATLFTTIGHFSVDSTDLFGVGLILDRVHQDLRQFCESQERQGAR